MLAGAQLERDAAAAFVSAQDVDAPGTERAGSCKVSHLGERLCWFVYLSVCVYFAGEERTEGEGKGGVWV